MRVPRIPAHALGGTLRHRYKCCCTTTAYFNLSISALLTWRLAVGLPPHGDACDFPLLGKPGWLTVVQRPEQTESA